MDVFALRDQVVDEYRSYVESFVNILDPQIEEFVREKLAGGELWPDAVLQLNPAFEPGPTLAELRDTKVIAPETARFFGPCLRLHKHQQDALDVAQRGEPYIVSTGTGSGKSLTYLLPIFDQVVKSNLARHSVRAIIVYPMNALVNSQVEALEQFQKRNWPDCPVRFAQYTGQVKDEKRQELLNDPPHILLTNYVMLEYLLIRPHERVFLQQATRELRWIVLDELHVYRGRQGSDVAMLLRRVKQRAANPDLQFVGTSATLATEGKRDERRARIAELGETLFGIPFAAANVVDETLRRQASVESPRDATTLAAAVNAEPPNHSLEAVRSHPLAAWVEETFGVESEDGRLVRRKPVTFVQGLRRLADESKLDILRCDERLKAVLAAGNTVRTSTGDPLFAFRLHQFLSSGSSIYATLQAPEARELTTEGQYVAPARDGSDGDRLLYPLAFCRDCGQEYYLAARTDEAGGGARLIPRSPLLNAFGDDSPGTFGFFAPERDGLWAADEDLPDSWYEQRAAGPRVKSNYKPFEPAHCWVRADGAVFTSEAEGSTRRLVYAAAAHAVPPLSGGVRPARTQRFPKARHAQPDRSLDRDNHPFDRDGCSHARERRYRSRCPEGAELH